jgi:aminoglycoside 6'-N-acetyltransferase
MAELVLRPMLRGDLPRISVWLEQPHVRQWWIGEDADPAIVEEKYGPRIAGREPTEMFVICWRDRPVGFIQRYLIADYPEWERSLDHVPQSRAAAGIDYLVGELDATNQGVGTAAIQAFLPSIYARWPVASVVVAVQQANRPSWRALERAGFARVWAGTLDSEDPSDAEPAFIYCHRRSS